MRDPDLQALLEARGWRTPAGRELALWLAALAAPTLLFRPWWAARLTVAAMTARRKAPRG